MFSYKSIIMLSLLAMTQALPLSKLSARQSAIVGSPTEVTSSNGDTLFNIQTYNGTLGSNPVPVYYDAGLGVANGNRPFNVSGVMYDGVASALQNSCSIQMNACADAVNDGSIAGVVSDCTDQQGECNDVATTISASAEFSNQKKRDLESDTGSVAAAPISSVDGSGTATSAISVLKNCAGLKAVNRAIYRLFDVRRENW